MTAGPPRTPTDSWCRAWARTPRAWPGCVRSTARGRSGGGSPAAGRCSGICVGMQVLFERGIEHGVETEGCDEWPGLVERLQAPIVPHMGWNTVEAPTDSRMFEGVEGERFYFVHSYGVRDWELETHGRTAGAAGDVDRDGSVGAGPVRRGGRERPAVGDPVPPREVRRRRRRTAAATGWRPCEPGMSKERQKQAGRAGGGGGGRGRAAGGRGGEAGPPGGPQGEADRLGARGAGPPDRAAGREAAPSGGRRPSRSWSRSTCWSSRSPRTSTSPASPLVASLLGAPILHMMLFRKG